MRRCSCCGVGWGADDQMHERHSTGSMDRVQQRLCCCMALAHLPTLSAYGLIFEILAAAGSDRECCAFACVFGRQRRLFGCPVFRCQDRAAYSGYGCFL